MQKIGYAAALPDDWGARAVHWIRNRFPNWPTKAIARELDEPESVVKSWLDGTNLPSRAKLQKLREKYGREGFSSFVFGEPCRAEIAEIAAETVRNIIKLSGYLNAKALGEEARRVARAHSLEADGVGDAIDGSKVKRA